MLVGGAVSGLVATLFDGATARSMTGIMLLATVLCFLLTIVMTGPARRR
jgi:hypothetical protein